MCLNSGKQWHLIVSCHSFLDGYELVAENKTCYGSKTHLGNFTLVSECASSCKSTSSMFIVSKSGHCFCELTATHHGTCNTMDNNDYSLYKFDNSGK